MRRQPVDCQQMTPLFQRRTSPSPPASPIKDGEERDAMEMRARTLTAHINDRAIDVQPRETLLQAALRNGIDFPNSCRVGGCATCKCRLADGQVKELTETAYLLSDEEVERGFI